AAESGLAEEARTVAVATGRGAGVGRSLHVSIQVRDFASGGRGGDGGDVEVAAAGHSAEPGFPDAGRNFAGNDSRAGGLAWGTVQGERVSICAPAAYRTLWQLPRHLIHAKRKARGRTRF